MRQCDQAMLEPFGAPTHAFCANVYAAAGRRSLSTTIANDLLVQARNQYVDPFFVGVAFLSVDPTRVLELFEKAYDERSPNIVGGVRHTPWIQSVTGNPRLRTLIDRMKLPVSSASHPFTQG